MSNPTSNFGWQMPTNSDLVTDLPADFEVFGQGVDTTLADLKGGTTGQILSKASNTDMDFTWTNLNPGDITGVTATSPLTGGGTSGDVTIGIQAASTSQSGAVQLSDSTSTTSSVLASTPTATKAAYDLANTANTTANAAIPKSLVDAKGDIVTATADNTPSRLAVGTDGYLLTADSTAANGIKWAAAPATGYWKNPVLNSNFSVWQRGTSVSLAAGTLPNSAYTADRFQMPTNANQACTVSRQLTNDNTNLPFIQYCARFQRNSGQTGTGALNPSYSFESIDSRQFAGKTVTFSFYARKGADFSGASSAVYPIVAYGTGTDQTIQNGFTGQTTFISGTTTLTTTWQRFTYSGTVGTTATQLGFYFNWTPSGTAGVNDYFEITGIQIEVGSSATAYYPNGNTYQAELAACQRYYYRTTGNSAGGHPVIAATQSITSAYCYMPLPVTMRTNPTSIDYANVRLVNYGVAAYSISSLNIDSTATSPACAVFTADGASGMTANRPVFVYAIGITNYIGVNAEL